MSNFKALCTDLENAIQKSYEEGVSMEEAEKLASKFLYAQIQVSNELRKADLDSRMRKSGLKAVRAAIYTTAKSDTSAKLTEAGVAAVIDTHEVVQGEQNELDKAEVTCDELERFFNIFKDGHVHFRTIAKGRFE